MRNSWTRQRQICRLAICSASGDAEQPVPLHSVPCSYDQIHGQEPFTNFWKFLCKIHSFFKFFNTDISQKNFEFLTFNSVCIISSFRRAKFSWSSEMDFQIFTSQCVLCVLYAFLLYKVENTQTSAILDQPFQGTALNWWYLCGNTQPWDLCGSDPLL